MVSLRSNRTVTKASHMAREMDQWAEWATCLLYKYEDWSPDYRTHLTGGHGGLPAIPALNGETKLLEQNG